MLDRNITLRGYISRFHTRKEPFPLWIWSRMCYVDTVWSFNWILRYLRRNFSWYLISLKRDGNSDLVENSVGEYWCYNPRKNPDVWCADTNCRILSATFNSDHNNTFDIVVEIYTYKENQDDGLEIYGVSHQLVFVCSLYAHNS